MTDVSKINLAVRDAAMRTQFNSEVSRGEELLFDVANFSNAVLLSLCPAGSRQTVSFFPARQLCFGAGAASPTLGPASSSLFYVGSALEWLDVAFQAWSLLE